jgi:iron(III) transport system permease protein
VRRPSRSEPVAVAATVLVVALLIVLVAVPLGSLVRVAAEDGLGGIVSTLRAPGVGRSIASTIALSTVVTVIAVPLGATLTLALRRRDLPARGLLLLGVLLPLLVPEFVLGYSWTTAYARGGFTDSVFGVSWPLVLGPVGVAVVLVVNAVPVVALLVAAGLATRADPDLERAAPSVRCHRLGGAAHGHAAVVAAVARRGSRADLRRHAGELRDPAGAGRR